MYDEILVEDVWVWIWVGTGRQVVSVVGWGRKKAADITPRTKDDDFSDTQVIYEPLNIKLLNVRL